tara:strand:- start:115 stop:216 length:102 start_codon:yes stop_codon:yes gene_type:complete
MNAATGKIPGSVERNEKYKGILEERSPAIFGAP